MTARDQWLAKLADLRIDRSRGPAPHKPLLLLSVLARVDEGETLPAVLPLTPELAFRFQTLWAVVAHRRPQRPEVRMPFHHLESDGVWAPLLADGTHSPHRGQTGWPPLTRTSPRSPPTRPTARTRSGCWSAAISPRPSRSPSRS